MNTSQDCVNIDSLDSLLIRLNRGDSASAERLFLEYEPYLRKVVRRLLPARLRAKFESLDVIQSVYGDVLAAFRRGGMRFTNVAQLRAFLIRATRNRFIDRVRQHQTAARLEQSLNDTDPNHLQSGPEPSPSEVLQADELWERLLALCPTEHHEILRLRRDGVTTNEIASRVGMHVGSIRRVLRNLSLRLACSGTVRTEVPTP